jgi:hypothetical protein
VLGAKVLLLSSLIVVCLTLAIFALILRSVPLAALMSH